MYNKEAQKVNIVFTSNESQVARPGFFYWHSWHWLRNTSSTTTSEVVVYKP